MIIVITAIRYPLDIDPTANQGRSRLEPRSLYSACNEYSTLCLFQLNNMEYDVAEPFRQVEQLLHKHRPKGPLSAS